MSWPNERQRDGGLDRIALPPDVPGRLFLCGKQAAATRYDSGAFDTVVCLTERHEIDGHYPHYVAWLLHEGSLHEGSGTHRKVAPTLRCVPDPICKVWWPIPDLHAPTVAEMRELVTEIAARLRGGDRVLVHCAAGKGRAGTAAVCVLVELGHSVADATRIVGQCRPGAGPEVGVQRELVEAFGAAVR